ncbi:MAG: DUF4395 family protein, partial [Candidatus Heimdallarchaeota archaeon]|nr:DUF4395 family protein [Candidatus Heimdallarchaeota archaeon]
SIDFILRYIHPKFSPLAQISKYISQTVLKNPMKPVFSPPKRFAVLIGIVITSLMSISLLIFNGFGFYLFLIFLLIASGLQSWFDYCLGCTVANFLVKKNLMMRGETVYDFSNNLRNLNSITMKDLSPNVIRDNLTEIAKKDGKITDKESRLIDQITLDLEAYSSLLDKALEDNVITEQEQRSLWHDRNTLVRKAYEIASEDGNVDESYSLVEVLIQILTKFEMIEHQEILK